MPVFLLFGWLIGLALGAFSTVLAVLALGLSVPLFLGPLAGILAPIFATLGAIAGVLLALLALIVSYLVGYTIVTASIAPLLPGLTGRAAPIFPLATRVSTPTAATVPVPPTSGEFFGRGLMIGITAMTNSLLLFVLIPLPPAAVFLSAWVFIVVSLSAIVFVARNRVYQGFLGWSGWLCPLSYLATAVGFLLYLINLPFALIDFGLPALNFDWTTGVFHQSGGLARTATSALGFSLGNFVFVRALPVAGAFTATTTDSHETGHSLNTAALGGVVLWINAIDENIVPPRQNLSYGELTAEGHAQNFGSTPPDFFVNWWV